MDAANRSVLEVYNLMCRVKNTFVMGGQGEDPEGAWGQSPDTVDLEALMEEVRTQMVSCREQLVQVYPGRVCDHILFAFCVFFDEIIMIHVPGALGRGWNMLQQLFYDTDQGGELFFDALDEDLAADYPSAVYETYYFCLNLGFRGKYADNESRIKIYRHNLEERFTKPEESVGPVVIPAVEPKLFKRYSYLWYYAVALSGNAMCWFWIRSAT